VETADSLRATWEAPLNSEECGVAYEVIYENEILGSSAVEVVGLAHDFNIELIPCTDYTITVTPISFTGSKGTPVSQEVTPSIRVGSVNDLIAADVGDSVVLSWSTATVGVCPLVYIVNYAVNDVQGEELETTEVSVTFNRIPCSDSQFSVKVLSEGIVGPVAVANLELGSADINSITQVEGLNLDGTILSWSPPVTVGLCEIVYIVDIENTFGLQQTATRDLSIDLELIPCSRNLFVVRGSANGITGEPATIEEYAPIAELAPPTHVRTKPAFTSADITLQGQAISENICRVETAILECSDISGGVIEREIEVMDNTPRIFTVLLDDLEQDTIYTCVARLEDSAAGNEFSFRTVPLVEKDLIISDITEGGFLVSWIEDYGQQFVIGYELTIESLGPAHRVPDGCSVDTTVTTVSLSNEELSSAFVGGLPDYAYRVVLTTYYTLGLSLQSNTASARTLAGVPSLPENLVLDFVSGSTEAYNVSAILSWSSPCELNGGLRGFGFNITARFSLGGVEQSVTVNLGVDEDDVNAVISKTITDINPFFRYEVSVNVIAADDGPNAVLGFIPPAACVCDAA
ncbi:Fibronectin domain-containing protein, partial [Oryctes borbonicus]